MRPAAKRKRIRKADFGAAPSVAADRPTAATPTFDARTQLDRLCEAVKTWPSSQKVVQAPASTSAKSEPAPMMARWSFIGSFIDSHMAKSALALVAALALGWAPVERLLTTTSAQATINAQVVTIRAPIEGEVSAAVADLQTGAQLKPSRLILTVSNPRADRTHLDELHRTRYELTTTAAALENRKKTLLIHQQQLDTQILRFREGRVTQLDSRVSDIDAQIAAARADHKVMADSLRRANSLFQDGIITTANKDRAVRDEQVAQETINGLNERRRGALVELEAARNGTFIGDSSNDTPQSAQRRLDLSLQLADIDARLAGASSELTALDARITAEDERHQKRSEAVIRAPVQGRVWEVLTTPGEHVRVGQDLLRILDCGNTIVTASVSETAYQGLSIGERATFRPRGSSQLYQGAVIGLHGMAAVASNDAIQQKALSREPFHVTLRFPELARNDQCLIGRSGLVTFDTSTAGRTSPTP